MQDRRMRDFSVIQRALMLVASGLILSGLLAGCPNDEAEFAAISKGRTSGQTPSATPSPPSKQLVGGEEDVGEPQEYVGIEVEVTILEVKAPYPRFDGTGRYDIKVEARAKEVADPNTVWKIIAYNAEDEVVATQEQQLIIPSANPRTLKFADFYCKSMPSRLEIKDTGRTSEAAEGKEEDGAAPGRPGAGGGGSPPGIGAGGSGGDDDDEDEWDAI